MLGGNASTQVVGDTASGGLQKTVFNELLQQLGFEFQKLMKENAELRYFSKRCADNMLVETSWCADSMLVETSCQDSTCLRSAANDVEVFEANMLQQDMLEVPGAVQGDEQHVSTTRDLQHCQSPDVKHMQTVLSSDLREIWMHVPSVTDIDVHQESQQAIFTKQPRIDFGNVWKEVRETCKSGSPRPSERQSFKQGGRYNELVYPFITNPNNTSRVIWDILGALFILYDMITIPLSAFRVAVPLMDWITLLFWTLNMPATLLVSYTSRGHVVKNPMKILKNYFKLWFWIDLVVVVPDWITSLLTLGTESTGGKVHVKMMRSVRLVRIVRIVKLLTFKKIMARINDLFNTEIASILANIVKMILYLVMVNHVIACLWWTTSASNDAGWVKHYQLNSVSVFAQYLTSFHWSITQFTPSSMHIQPQTTEERLFAVAVVVFGLVCFSYLVGSITGSLSQLRGLQDESQFWKLRRFLRQNNINGNLATKIEKYLQYRWNKMGETMSRQSIPVLKFLSKELDAELQANLAVPHLSVHPMFERLVETSTLTIHRLALTVIEYRSYAAQDLVFVQGEVGHHMRFQVGGSCQYFQFKDHGAPSKEVVHSDGNWISEQVLWMKEWRHQGILSAISESELLMISPAAFADVVSQNPQAMLLVSNYAQQFAKWFHATKHGGLSDVFYGEDVFAVIKGLLPPRSSRISLKKRAFTSLSWQLHDFRASGGPR